MNTKISEVENKILDTSSLVTTTVLNTKISEVEKKIPDNSNYITIQEFNKLNKICWIFCRKLLCHAQLNRNFTIFNTIGPITVIYLRKSIKLKIPFNDFNNPLRLTLDNYWKMTLSNSKSHDRIFCAKFTDTILKRTND